MSFRALSVAMAVLIGVLLTGCAPTATPVPPSAVPPTAAAGLKTFHSPESSAFHLPLSITYGPEWDSEVVVNNIDVIDKSAKEWWGPSILLLDGAHVLDAAKVADTAADLPALSELLPVPNDLFAYVRSIPGVEVIQGPDPVTIGGIEGSQIVIDTPAMHPFLWLKDDTSWHGGGPSGVDTELRRLLIILEVDGEPVLLEYLDSPAIFDERAPTVEQIFNSITFGE